MLAGCAGPRLASGRARVWLSLMVGPVRLARHGNKNATKQIFIILFNMKSYFNLNLMSLNNFFIKITKFI
jgi:hypothetical protein